MFETTRSQMDLGDGIALNEALRENLFMLLVSAGKLRFVTFARALWC